MITTLKLDHGFSDETVLSLLVRRYAQTKASGYVCAVNLTPFAVNYSEVLNIDLVLSEYPPMLSGRFEFDYSNPEKRIARRTGWGVGKFEHLHLSADQPTINFLLQHFGKKVWLDGDELAIQSSGKSWFWQTSQALELLQVDASNELHKIVKEAERLAAGMGESACHSISVHSVADGREIRCGSGMAGHFSAAAAGVAAYGGSIAQNSVKKAREASKENYKNSEGGKNKEAADRLDMQNRMENLRNQQKRGG